MPDFFKVLDPVKDIKIQSFAQTNALISLSSQAQAVTNNITIFTAGPYTANTINKPDSLGSTTAGISPSGSVNSIAKQFFNRYGAQYLTTSGVYSLPAAHTVNVNVDTARIIEVSDPTKDHGIWPDSFTAVLTYNGASITAVDSAADSFGPNRENLEFGLLTDSIDKNHILGSIFYDYGMVVLHGGTGSASAFTTSAVTGFAFRSAVTGALTASTSASTVVMESLAFRTYKMLTRSLMFCRLENSEFNYTSNPSAQGVDFLQNENQATTYITTVGMFDDRDNLLAVAKISPPLRKNAFRETTIVVTLAI